MPLLREADERERNRRDHRMTLLEWFANIPDERFKRPALVLLIILVLAWILEGCTVIKNNELRSDEWRYSDFVDCSELTMERGQICVRLLIKTKGTEI